MTDQKQTFTGSTNDIKIEVAQDSDLPQVLAIWQQGLKENFPDMEISQAAIEIFINNFKNRKQSFNFWVAKETSVLGWCSILPAFSHPLKKNYSGEVSTYIDEEKAPKGLGTRLMKYAFREIQKTEIENVWGFANTGNLRSIKMCKNAGMYVCGNTIKKIILVIEFE